MSLIIPTADETAELTGAPKPAAPVPTWCPKRAILDRIEFYKVKLPRPLLNFVLLAQYIPADKIRTAGGMELHVAEVTQREAEWTGLSGLVLTKGPDCYTYGKDKKTGQDLDPDRSFDVGDWCMFSYYETQASKFRLHGMVMAIVEDKHFRAVISDPQEIKG